MTPPRSLRHKHRSLTTSSSTNKRKSKLSSRIDWMYLSEFLKIRTPSSGEELSHSCLSSYLHQMGYTHVNTDPFGNMVVHVTPQLPNRLTLLIDAHFDEIGYSILDIDEQGYLYFVPIGGADKQITNGMFVWIHSRHGLVKGIIGNKSIHLKDQEEEESVPKWDQMYIDIGCTSREEAEGIVSRGDLVTSTEETHWIGTSRIAGRALDNHIGCFIVLQVLHLLQKEKESLPFNLIVSFTTQEETNLGGGKQIAHTVPFDAVFVVDLDTATDHPHIHPHRVSPLSLGKGVVLSRDLKSSHTLFSFLEQVATSHHIPYQRMTHMEGDTNYSMMYNRGIPGMILSVCGRYLHSSVTTVDVFDVQAAIFLLYHALHQFQELQSALHPYFRSVNKEKKKHHKHSTPSGSTKKCKLPLRQISISEGLSHLMGNKF